MAPKRLLSPVNNNEQGVFTMRLHTMLVPAVTALLLAGCGSSTSASKSNFAKAINTALAKNCVTANPSANLSMAITDQQYPVGVQEQKATSGMFGGTTQAQADKQNAANFGPFDALVKSGLLTVTTGEVKDAIFHKSVPGRTYTLTTAGEKALRDKNGLAFCAGHWQVKEVTNFTEPGKAMDGATRSTVQFTYAAADVPSWTAAAISAGFPYLKQTLDAPGKGRADLVLTNNGWEAQIDTLNAQ